MNAEEIYARYVNPKKEEKTSPIIGEFLSPRQSGRTTKQILNAPINSFYVVSIASEIYSVKRLCDLLNRSDIKVISISNIERKMSGVTNPVVFDHYLHEISINDPELYNKMCTITYMNCKSMIQI